jgi:drug/metabolite transporter (DMT)-like permease
LTAIANAPKPLQSNAVGFGFVMLSGLGVVFLPTTAKFAYLDGSNVLTVAVARGIVAVTLLGLIVVCMRLSFRLPRELLRSSLVAGIGQAFFVFGVLAAITSINISLALLILYLYPIVLAIHQHRQGVNRLGAAQWLSALIAVAGLALILGVGFDEINLIGILLALMSMLATVVITITNHRVTATVGSLVSNFHMSLWSLFIFSLLLLLVGTYAEPQSTLGWIALGGNGVAYCVAWVSFFAGARILGATRASMLTLVEPPAAAFGAWLLFGETYTALQWFGFFVVLAALFAFEKQAQPVA